MKLTTGKQAVSVASEVLESFGGAGYVEDTGLPVLLRDAQVMPIWEGTTNVLALDTLRALRGGDSLKQLQLLITSCVENVSAPNLADAARVVRSSFDHATTWLAEAERAGQHAVEAGARRFSLTLGRTVELALLIRQAQWSKEKESDDRSTASARRFAHSAIDLIWTGFQD